jgi:hypothetical protein
LEWFPFSALLLVPATWFFKASSSRWFSLWTNNMDRVNISDSDDADWIYVFSCSGFWRKSPICFMFLCWMKIEIFRQSKSVVPNKMWYKGKLIFAHLILILTVMTFTHSKPLYKRNDYLQVCDNGWVIIPVLWWTLFGAPSEVNLIKTMFWKLSLLSS